VTWQEYETGLDEKLADLHSRVHLGTYRAQPSKRAYIPKADGRRRPVLSEFFDFSWLAVFQVVQHFKVLLAVDFASGIPLSNNLLVAGSGIALIMTAGRSVFGARTEAIANSLFSFRELSFDRLPGR
jgi:hypothetical protein